MARSVVAAAIVTVAIAWPAAARADAAHAAEATAAFDEAKRLEKAGDVPGACRKFEESQSLDPQLGTLLNLALCHERDKELAAAWSEFVEVVSLATRAGQKPRAELAKSHAYAIEKDLSWVTVVLPAGVGSAEIKMDDRVVASSAKERARIPADVGDHVVVVSSPGKLPRTEHVNVPQRRAELELRIAALDAAPVPAAEPTAPRATIVAPEAPPPSSGARTAGWIGVGIGAAAVAFGAVAGAIAISNQNVVRQECPTEHCLTQRGLDADSAAHTWSTASTIGFAAGLGLAAAGLVILLVTPSHAAPSRTALLTF